jgi:monoamine oxidase
MTVSIFRSLRALVEPHEVSRRGVLKSAAVLAGGLFLHEYLTAAAAPEERENGKRVLVIGAGFAGLACADELAYAGYRVTVVEARRRVGGRVETRKDLVPGKTVEAGGELVGPNQPTWVAYKERFGLTFDPLEDKPKDVIELNGKMLNPVKARKLYDEFRQGLRRLNKLAEPIPAYTPWEHPKAAGLDARSLRDWIDEQKDLSDACRACIHIQFTAINGMVPAWQSFLGVLAIVKGGGLDDFWDETDTCHVRGGCTQLADKLRESLEKRGGTVLIDTPVRAVRLHQNGVEVTYRNGEKDTWDDVILTAPPSVWNKIDFTPALPPGLSTPLADNVKYLAVTNGRPWDAVNRSMNALSDGAVQLTWETTSKEEKGNAYAIVAISGGPAADLCRSWLPDKRDTEYRKALDRFWPGFAKAWINGKLYDWLNDPYSRGSYSFPAPGQVTVAGPLLARGVKGRLHFAGEHCCYAFTGWMEGALASGVRLARRLCERDGLVKPMAH